MKLIYKEASLKPGIYKIFNSHTNRIYIGQAKRFKSRWAGHISSLKSGKNQNKFLLHDYNKCIQELGHDDFLIFEVVEVMEGSTKEERNKREEQIIAEYWDKQDKCYNFRQKVRTGERSCWSSTPEETSQKISKSNKGRIAWNKGKTGIYSEETLEKMSNAQKGKHSYGKGIPMKEETKKKVSLAKKAFYQTEKGQALIQKIVEDKQGKSYEEYYGEERAKEIKEKIRQNKLIEMNKPEVKENLRRLLKDVTEVERYGYEKAQEIKQKKSKARKGKYTGKDSSGFKIIVDIKLMSPEGKIYTRIEGIKDFALEHKLNPGHLSELLAGKRKSHRGWKLIKQ